VTRHAGLAVLAVSPHLDDAVMGAGATLAAMADAGHQVTVCTVFAGQPRPPFSPVACAFHADCGLGPDAVDRRRAEDRRALEILGADAAHLAHLDAIYRRAGDGWLCDAPRAMYSQDQPPEKALLATITADLGRLIAQKRPAAVWTCAAIGGHVDHVLTRRAGG
jgi:LmbE family N-acetylglucosaminyl deacetylase